MTNSSLPGTPAARLKNGFLLISVLIRRGAAIAGLRSLDYAFARNRPRELRKPLRLLVRFGYWLLGGVTTGDRNSDSKPGRPTSELP
jgi:hypothetical protein